MRRNNEKSKASVYNPGRGITGQTLLYQHMSNHYRRILNAKKSIDTAPPTTFKPKQSSCSASNLPAKKFSNVKKCSSGHVSPALTERTTSSYSNGGSYWRNEFYYGNKCHDSRDRGCCCRAGNDINPDGPVMELVNHIPIDTKSRPSTCTWKDADRTHNSAYRSPYEPKKSGSNQSTAGHVKRASANKSKLSAVKRKLPLKEKPSLDLMEKHSKCFISHNNSFYPRILKTNATSRLKSSRVYHPPRKRNGTKRGSRWKEEMQKNEKSSIVPVNGIKSKCVVMNTVQGNKCKPDATGRETSQTSSRDSAYNGGVSSLPESRSPTPDQRKQSNCCCHGKSENFYDNGSENIIVPNLKLTDNQNTQTETIQTSQSDLVKSENLNYESKSEKTDYARDSTPKQGHSRKLNTFGNTVGAEGRDYIARKIKEEALYTNFIREITAEALEKGLYTNKALKKVMKRHVVSNLWLLDKDRMLNEINKLRIQLGIPEDDDLLDIKDGLASTADVDECYSIISDSELSLPHSRELKRKKKKKSVAKIEKVTQNSDENDESMPKSISDVINNENGEIVLDTDSEEDDDELISVIQVTNMVRENMGNEPSSDASVHATQGQSADESEQSSDHVSRKKKTLTRVRKVERTSSSSDDRESSAKSNGRRAFGGRFEARSESEKDSVSKSKRGTKHFTNGMSKVDYEK